MFPIRDHNPSEATPYVTWALILANIAVFLATIPLAARPGAYAAFLGHWALIPALSAPETFVTSQFLHGGLLHLAGNMLFLWIFGDNMEEALGRLGFLALYLGAGVAAGLAQVAAAPGSTLPMVGASGAIAGVMGGYLLMFPRARVDVLVIVLIFFRVIPVPAWLMLGAWFALQAASGALAPPEMGGVAYMAHVGGFLAGLVLTLPAWARRGGPAYWRRTGGRPPHPEAAPRLVRSSVPRVRRRR